MPDEFLDLVGDLRGQLEEQIKLDEINKKILATLDLDEVLNLITTNTCELLDCDRVTVFVVMDDPDNQGVKNLISRKAAGGETTEIRVPYDHNSIAGYIACKKTFEGRLPKTEYRLTKKGRAALQRYLSHMEALISAVRE